MKLLSYFLIGCIIGLVLGAMNAPPKYHQVTWYAHTGHLTASGETYDEELYTCAVKDRADMKHWFVLTYGKRSVRVWANDIIPKAAAADFDLTPEAFTSLAPLGVGRLYGVEARRE